MLDKKNRLSAFGSRHAAHCIRRTAGYLGTAFRNQAFAVTLCASPLVSDFRIPTSEFKNLSS
jgi:hypothetical protein